MRAGAFQFLVFSFQFSVFSFQFSVFSFRFSVFGFRFSVLRLGLGWPVGFAASQAGCFAIQPRSGDRMSPWASARGMAVIRIVVIAQSRHVCRCFATQANAPNDYLGPASEAGAWPCFAIQSQRNERVVVLQRDVRVVESQRDVM